MTSQAERLRRKRAQQKAAIRGQDNPMPSKHDEAPNAVAIAARARVYGLPAEKASDPLAGTGIGRAYLQGQISLTQHDALDKAQRLYQEHRRAISTPQPLAKQACAGGGDAEHRAFAEWAASVLREYDEMKAFVREAQMGSRAANLFAAFDYAVTRDEMHDSMLGCNRMLANVLARFFKVPG